MATYTISQQPALFSPAYNDLVFVVTSSNKTQTSFNYIATIYIGSDQITLKSPADPTYGSGVFNFGRIVEAYVNSDIDKSTYGFQRNTNSYIGYYVKFGEEYGSTITQYLNITTSVVKYVWNGVLDFLETQTYNQDGYTMEGAGTFLTSFLGERNQLTGDYSWLYWVADGSSPTSLSHMDIKSYTSAGALIKSVGFTNPYSSSGTITNHFARFSTGKPQLNTFATIDMRYGTSPAIPSNAAYYKVAFQDASSGTISSIVTYNIVDSDCKYTAYRLHFLNRLGGFDSYNFTKVSHNTTEIKKSQYKAPIGALTSASAFGYNKYDRGDRQYSIISKDTIKLSSDWLSEAESTWLRELVESPEIYLDDSTYGLVSVTCQETRYEKKQQVNEKLFRLEIDLNYSYNRYRQRY